MSARVRGTHFGALALISLGTLGCGVRPNAPPPLLSGTPPREGDTVWTQSGGIGGTGLWLFYEDRCESDVTYERVHGSTPAVLTGDLCFEDGEWYAKLSFSAEQKRQHEITSDNTWLPLTELDRTPQE